MITKREFKQIKTEVSKVGKKFLKKERILKIYRTRSNKTIPINKPYIFFDHSSIFSKH